MFKEGASVDRDGRARCNPPPPSASEGTSPWLLANPRHSMYQCRAIGVYRGDQQLARHIWQGPQTEARQRRFVSVLPREQSG
jgi:hypothetical protein